MEISKGPVEDPKGSEPVRVSEVRRAWLVRTDEEFAHKLQDDEIVNHLSGNKYRNEQIREDFPAAQAVQAHDEDYYKRELQQKNYLLEEDARVAQELQKKLSIEKRNRQMQHKYSSHHASDSRESYEKHHSPNNIMLDNQMLNATKKSSDEACSIDYHMETPPDRKKIEISSGKEIQNRRMTIPNSIDEPSTSKCEVRKNESVNDIKELVEALGVPREKLYEEQQRLLQEEQDAKMARLLNDSEEFLEARDCALAQILQDREIERFHKSKQKHKQKHLQKLAQTQQRLEIDYNKAVLSDTYSQPRDVLHGQNCEEGDNDPHYMEVLSSRGSIPAFLNEQSLDSHRNRRTPPEVPKYSGRPKLAEPHSTLNSKNFDKMNSLKSEPEKLSEAKKDKTDKKKKKKDMSTQDAKVSKCTIH